jgi:hypothetical protein
MQTVSENWKNVHKQTLLNESYVEVSLDIADPDALVDASSQDNGAVYISDTSEIVNRDDKNIVPYCTLEQNIWLLDGNRRAIPEAGYGESAYIGNVLSNEVCVFSEKIPTITINFSKVFDVPIPGVTITWSRTYGEFADSFIVTAYNGDTVVAQKEVFGNRSIKSLVMVDIVDYDRIVIQITKWCLPHHRARVEEVFAGINKVYSKTELFGYTHKQSVDPISTSLPKTGITFSVDNAEGEYNPYNERGLAKYLMERQEVKARYGLKLNDGSVEWIKGGTFYLSEWYAKQNGLTAEFEARDLLELMQGSYSEYHDATSRTLYALAEKVLRAANLPLNTDGTVKWIIDEALKSIETTATLPNDTFANCLELIANAGRCVLYQDRDGMLRIEPLTFEVTDYAISAFNSYSKPEMTLAKPIKQVDVNQYYYWVVDSEMHTNATRVETYVVGTVGETVVVDNPLITDPSVAKAVAEWVGTYLKNRITLDTSWRADVRLDALDLVTSENSYNTNNIRMTEVEFTFNGAFRGKGEGRVI